MQTDLRLMDKIKESVIGGLILAQVILLCYLLALDVSATLLLVLLCGLPVALLCNLLLSREPRLRSIEMSVVMFSAGGFGMLLGSVADLGQFGLYDLLSWCQTTSAGSLMGGFEKLWLKMQFMPWTYVGMFAGSNIGMILFDKVQRPWGHNKKCVSMYLICNVGMLLGMWLGESVTMALIEVVSPFWSATTIVMFMLLGMMLGMMLGMFGLLDLSARIRAWGAVPLLKG